MNTDDRIRRDRLEQLATGLSPQAMSHIQLVTVYRKGHFIHWTATRDVQTAVAAFLSNLPR
jgi:hypothetical protein